LDAPLAQTPSNFGPKRCFLASNTPYPSGVKNLVAHVHVRRWEQCVSSKKHFV